MLTETILTPENSPFSSGPHQEVHQLGGNRGRRWLAGAEAEDLLPREQPGTADQGAQAAGAGQCRSALRTAQAGEAPPDDDGARQGAGDGPEGSEGRCNARSQALPVRGGSHQGGSASEEPGPAWTTGANR